MITVRKYKGAFACITLGGEKVRTTPGLLKRVVTPLADKGINIYAISCGEHATSFFVEERDVDEATKLLTTAISGTAYRNIEVRRQIGHVSVTGPELTSPGMFDKILAPIARAKINILQVTSSYDSLLLFFDFAKTDEAYKILNKEVPKILK